MGAIDNFYSLMVKSKGFARPARYEVVLHPPPGLTDLFPNSSVEGFSLMCDSITMPGHDLQATGIKFGTEVETQMVTSHGYTGLISATFYLDHNLDLKEFFDAWQLQAVNTDTNAVSYYKKDGVFNYVGSIDIHQLTSVPVTITTETLEEDTSGGSGDHRTSANKHGFVEERVNTHEPIRTYSIKAEEVYPETIGAIEYAYATVDEIARLTVGFQYRRWKEI